MLAAQAIATGQRQVVVAGGMESMSNAPHLLPRAALDPRFLGAGISLRDSLVTDGLWDNCLNQHMGSVAEQVAEELGISRNDQVQMGEAVSWKLPGSFLEGARSGWGGGHVE